MSGPALYLGVDGGGTKTALALVTADGDVVGSAVGPTTYYLGSPRGPALVGEVLSDGVREACRQAGARPADVAFAFLGLPAYGEIAGDVAALDAEPRAALGHDRYRCGNDVVAGWAGSLGASDGVHVVAGTGSIAYGERSGVGARAGGWGEVFGDEGSGHWLGLRGLALFSQMSDGRAPAGPLLDVLREHFSLTRDLDLLDLVLGRWRGDRGRIAALSPLVVAAADGGDAAAGALVDEAGAHLAAHVAAVRAGVGFTDDDVVPVSYSGGVFHAPRVLAAFTRTLRVGPGAADVRAPLMPPVSGAAAHAARLAGAPLAGPALDRLAAWPGPGAR